MAELETYAFNADISQLMSLIINAFYSNKEIFLRELISNASDAMDKIQYDAASNPEILKAQPDFYIKVTPDREARTIIVEDSGIAMTRDEMINHLGTIAKSGTKAFMEAVSAGADMSMIGQFGVGFYSSYLVSEKVRVVSKSNDDEQYVWESSAAGTFLVWKDEEFEHGRIARGTKVICYLKSDQDEFLESDRLKELILKHSAFVGFPITCYMDYRKEEDIEGSDEKKVDISYGWELINKNKPVWLRPVGDVSHEEYADLYKWLAGDYEDHLAVKHVDAAQHAIIDLKALVYCPRSAPKDMFDMGKMASRFSIRLYVRRVFIKEFNDLIPKWMSFIKGIVDSDDMPLNISREKLQENAILAHIKTAMSKHAFALFNEISKDKDKFKVFTESFSQCLKLGVYEDHANREQIIPLLRYYSSKAGDDLVSFDDYISRCKPGQRHILYISGRNRRDAARSPYIEGLKRDGYEIIYMTDPVDEYAVQFLKEYKGKELMSCQNVQAVQLLDHRTQDNIKAEFEPMRRKMQASLTGKVVRVAFGDGIAADSCGRVVVGDDGRVMELNIKHGLLRELSKRDDDGEMKELANFVYEVALLDGAHSEDPRRDDVSERSKDLIQRFGAGEKDVGADDLPVLGTSCCTLKALQPVELGTATKRKDVSLLSCGNAVRIVKAERTRRAVISFVDDDKVDVSYPLVGGGEEDEEGISVKSVQKLLDFELDKPSPCTERTNFQDNFFQTASAVKEQGNQVFKLKDYDAAQEKYTAVINAFSSRPISRGQEVLVVVREGKGASIKSELVYTTVTSVDRDGGCELSNGSEGTAATLLPVVQELLPLQTSVFMNRARCLHNVGRHKEAAQDLTTVLGLWRAANKRMLEADLEMKEAEAKGTYTAEYLRARSRLALGLVKLAGVDVKDALARNPPAATVKQLRQLKTEVQTAQEKYRQVNGPLAKELAKVSIFVRGGPKI